MAGIRLAESLRDEKKASSTGSLSDIFEEEPVDLTTFMTDRKFLKNPPLSPVQYTAVRHIEQIYLPQIYPLMAKEFGEYWNPVRFINFAYLQWGKGSGKDHVCQVSSARIMYLLGCLKSPQAYFNMPAQAEIQALNVALASGQAFTAFFKPLRNLVSASPWFNTYGFAPTDKSIRFNKQLEAVSGHSESETLEGLNIILGIADEIGAFRTKDEAERYTRAQGRDASRTAESILDLLRTSARTRFPKNFKNVAISYPRFKGDAIQQLTQQGLDDNEAKPKTSRIYVSGPLATWDVRPGIEREDFQDDYDRDPVGSRSKYECLPELSINQFFRNKTAVSAALSDRKPDPITFEYYWGTDDSGDKMYDETGTEIPRQPGWQVRFVYSPDFKPMQGAAYALHGDMAIRGDRAGVSMCHVRNWVEGDWQYQDTEEGELRYTRERRPIVKMDFTVAFEADLTVTPMPREIQIRWYRKLIFDLIARGFSIQRVTFDQFESADSRQILLSHGLETERVSMDINAGPYTTLKDVIYEGRLEGYWNPVLYDEIMSLTRLPNGKLDHPPKGSKDMSDALCGAVLGAMEAGGSEGPIPMRIGQGIPVDIFAVAGGDFVEETVPFLDEDSGVWDTTGFARSKENFGY